MTSRIRLEPPEALTPGRAATRPEIAAWLFAAAGLLGILHWHLLPALLAGLLVYGLTHKLAERLPGRARRTDRRKIIAVALIASAMVFLVAAAIFGLIAFFRSEGGSLPALMGRMAEIIEGSRGRLPVWLAEMLPADVAAIKAAIGNWLREHAAELQLFGKEAGRAAAHLLVGMIIGALVALREASAPDSQAPLAAALAERIRRLGDAFSRIVFAQVKISALNALFTAFFLAALLPLIGIQLPLVKTMIAITFIAGLIPVLGNLISNTVIVVVGLSHSLEASLIALLFLVIIHKLEYFLNARIVGAGVGARAWELLAAMLAMEAVFGLPGVVAAPIYYAYVKGELIDRGLI